MNKEARIKTLAAWAHWKRIELEKTDRVSEHEESEYQFVEGVETLLSELKRLELEVQKMFSDQVEWAVEHPVYQLSKNLEKENEALRAENFLLKEAQDFIATIENDDNKLPDWLWKKRNEILEKIRGAQ